VSTVFFAFVSFVLRVTVDLLNLWRDLLLVAHTKATQYLTRAADQLDDEDHLIPSLRFLLFNTDNLTDFVPPSQELVTGIFTPYHAMFDPVYSHTFLLSI